MGETGSLWQLFSLSYPFIVTATPGSSTPRRPKQESGPSPRDFEKRRQEITMLLNRRRELEKNIANCPNEMLKQAFQQQVEQVCLEIQAKEEAGNPFGRWN